MKISKKSILMAGACLPLIMTAQRANADNRVQYSAGDANELTNKDNTNKLTFTFSHSGRKGNTLTAKDPYSEGERNHGGFDERGFNSQGIHKVTGTIYDENGYDKDGYNARGFNDEGIHRDTQTEYDNEGYNVAGFNENGFYMGDGKYGDEGITRSWRTRDTLSSPWEYHTETTYPYRGAYDDEGYDVNGFNRDGYNRNGEYACNLEGPWNEVGDRWSATSVSNGSVQTGNCYECFTGDMPVTLADGSTKRADEISYDDELLVWDFDEGKFASAKPLWIRLSQMVKEYNYLRFSDGSVLKTINEQGTKGHRIFNQEAGKFTYPMTDETPLGTHTLNSKGEFVTLVEKREIIEKAELYNIITDHYINCFAGGVLTSCRLNNIYPIKDLKFVKDNRKITPYEQFAELDRKWYDGLRLGEQQGEINKDGAVDHGDASLVDYVKRIIKVMAKNESLFAKAC